MITLKPRYFIKIVLAQRLQWKFKEKDSLEENGTWSAGVCLSNIWASAVW